MKIVIDISKKYYEMLKFEGQQPNARAFAKLVANGTPLPKGHGALKDTDAICKGIISALGIRDESYLLEAEKAIYKTFKNANAIIEADKGEQE